MADCAIYELPNQTQEHLEYAEKEFEEMGADLDGDITFLGGTLYAHDYKARHPEANVTAIEIDPIAAYTHRFAGYQLENETEPEKIVEYLFNFPREKEDLGETIIDKKHYNEIKNEHRDFVQEEKLFSDEFLDKTFFMEPEYGAEEIHSCSLEDPNLPRDLEESNFLNTNGNIARRLLNNFKDSYLPGGYSEKVEETLDRAEEQFYEDNIVDASELRSLSPEPRSHNFMNPVDSLIYEMNKLKERSHSQHAMEEGMYIHATNTRDDQIKISKSARSADPTHERLLEEIETVERPDQILIEDARDLELNSDILFTNNVFYYFNSPEEVSETVENLTSEGEIYVEGTRKDRGMPERVNHVKNNFGGHLSTSLK